MSNLPFLHMTRIEVPKNVSRMKSRSRSQTVSRQMTASMPRTQTSVPSQPNDEYLQLDRKERASLENKCDDLIRGVPFRTIEPETLTGLIIVFKERKRRSLIENNYSLSQTLSDMIARLISMKFQIKCEAMRQQQIASINADIRQSKRMLVSIKKKWDEKIQKFNEEQAAAAKELEETHAKQLEDFDNSIPDELPPQFCKLTPDLLNMMEIERKLVLTKEYDQAKKLQKENEKRKQVETEEQKRKYFQLVEKQREALVQEQEHAIECFTARWTREAEKLNKQKDKEITTQEKVIEHYETDLGNVMTFN